MLHIILVIRVDLYSYQHLNRQLCRYQYERYSGIQFYTV